MVEKGKEALEGERRVPEEREEELTALKELEEPANVRAAEC